MNDSQQLREQMWDLVYGLLETEESQDLIAQIKSDPQAARLYAEVRLQADLVGYAARVEDSSFVLNVDPGAEKPAPAKREKSAVSAVKQQPAASRSRSSSRGGAWLAIAAATALAMLLAVGQFWPRGDERQLAAAYIVTEIVAPSSIPGGLANTVVFHTTTLGGEAQPATVDFALRGRGGRELLRQQVNTDNLGRASVEIPGSALEPGVRLEVFDVEALAAVDDNVADSEGEHISQTAQRAEGKYLASAAVAADLPVQAEPHMAYVLLEEPLAADDKPVNASVWNFGAFSGKPAPPETAEQVAQNMPGLALAEESGAAAAANELGVIKGVVQNQAVDGRAQGFAYQNSARAALGTMPAAEPAVAQQQPYFRAGQGQGGGSAEGTTYAPADLRLQRAGERVIQQERQQQAKEQRPELAQTTDGSGRYRQSNAEENRASAGQVTNVAPGEPINVEIPAEYANKQLVVAANTRGITIANTNTDRENKKLGAAARNKLGQTPSNFQLALPPEADGQIEVALLDPATSPPQLVSRNYVYREPARKLQIDVGKLKERFAPGEKVQVTLQVSDEAGRPAADTRLGVRLWNEQLVQQNAEQPLLLADALQAGLPGATFHQSPMSQSSASQLAANSSPPIESLAKAKATAGDTLSERLDESRAAKDAGGKAIAPPAGGAAPRPLDEQEKLQRDRGEGLRTEAQAAPIAPAAPAAPPAPTLQPSGQLLGEVLSADASSSPENEWFSNWGSVASQEPVELASNRDAVQAAYDAAASSAREERQRTLRAIGGAAIVGSVALLVLLAVLAASRMAGNFRILAPALAVSLASLLVGVAWVGWLPRGGWQEQRIAMTGAVPAAAEPAADSTDYALPSAAGTSSYEFADAPAPPTISLSDSASAPPAAGPATGTTLQRELAAGKPAEQPPAPTTPLAAGGASGALGVEQRQGGQAGGGGAAPESGVARDRLEIEKLERKLAANAPVKAAKEVAEKDGDKSAAGIAGIPVQPATTPAPAAAAPAAPATASLPAAGRSFGAAAADGKSEADVAGRAGVRFIAPSNNQAATAHAPASLYFNPNLQTNDQGLATIEFTMPPVDSQYRLLIDALGQGRIGSRQQLITIQGEAAKEAAK